MRPPHSPHWPSKSALLAAALLTAVSLLRIVATYKDFTQAYDEPAHIACGMEWLDKGTFRMEPQHPPLPRVMAALGPYLSGLRLPPIRWADGNKAEGYDFFAAGNEILVGQGQYERNLTLARLGTLPFLVLASIVTFLWARSLLGDWPAVLAVFLLTTLPTILGYCTLAYVDPALMALFPAALFAFIRWLDDPGIGRSMVLGLTAAGAALANAPWMVFLPPCGLAVLAFRWWANRGQSLPTPLLSHGGPAGGLGGRLARGLARGLTHWGPATLLALVTWWMVLWGGYRFTVEPLDHVFENPRLAVQRLHAPYAAKALIFKVIEINPSLPAPAFFQGVGRTVGEGSKLYPAYLFGKVRRGGWWYFYFFMLAFKTPPAFLLLALFGLGWGLRQLWKERDWRLAAPAVAVVVILLVGAAIKVNLGVRTILFIYPLLAILAALGSQVIWNQRDRWPRLSRLPALLIAILAFGSLWLHPNYLTYTSVLAGSTPDKDLVLDADFDAGQNLPGLAKLLKEKKVDHLKLRIYTSADLHQMGLPPFETLAPYERASGWVAVSVHHLRVGDGEWYPAKVDGYAWLNDYQPVASVDKVIRLYYLPAATVPQTPESAPAP